jgi:hypothetical protein
VTRRLPLSEHVFGRWLFSHEEDGARVYRPRDSPFAPSRRPRDGFDIEPDGRFRVLTPGAADASRARDGRWTASGARIQVACDDGGPGLALEIVDAAPGVLKVRRG